MRGQDAQRPRSEPERLAEIGILNLTRFGDLVQTSPVTAGLHKRHPGARVHLIVKRRFREVAELLPGVDCVHEIDGDALAQALVDPRGAFLGAYRQVREIVERLREVRYDVLYNFTHSRASSVLMSLLHAGRRVGYGLDRRGQRRVENPWLIHVGTLVRARKLVQLNLVDAYLGAAGLAGSGEMPAVRVSELARGFAARELAAGERWLAVQLGASQGHKTWGVAGYAAALRALAARVPGLRIALVGVAAEEPRERELRALAPELALHSLVGRTRIGELAAVLERCALLLTGDTGTMHLAAAVGTRTLAVFVGLGTPHETAAYGEGHWAVMSRIACAPCSHLVRCGRPVCHEDLPPEWLAAIAAALLAGRAPAELPPAPRASLYRTRLGDDGLLELVPAVRREPAPEELLSLAYREAFRASFCGEPGDARRPLRRAQEYYGTAAAQWHERLPAELGPRLAELERLGAQGERLSRALVRCEYAGPALREQALALRAVDDAVIAAGRAQPLLAPLALALEGEADALPDCAGDLAPLASASAENYARLAARARFVRALAASEGTEVGQGRESARAASREASEGIEVRQGRESARAASREASEGIEVRQGRESARAASREASEAMEGS